MWRPRVRTPDGFEGFYQETRDDLLLQCYALTGDQQAAQRAVRDAMVVARHHWRKVSRLERPEDWVRPLAWTRALRRSQVRWWSGRRGVDADDQATLAALGRLGTTQRKVLLLVLLTPSTLDAVAREVGTPRAAVERDLQTATAQFAVHRAVPSTAVRSHVERLTRGLTGVRWPRPSTVSRAGAARRRTHTVIGAAAVAVALVAAGVVVTESGGVAPALATKGLTHGGARSSSSPTARASRTPPEPDPLTTQALLTAAQLAPAVPGTWTQGATSRNTDGDGLVFTCQAARYADPQGLGALVRTFSGSGPKGGVLTAGQSAEASADDTAAQQGFTTTLGWYAGCAAPRVQLMSTHTVTGVGDQAALLVLQSWNQPETTQVVGVARTGRLVTTVVSTQPDGAQGAGREPVDVDLATRAALLGSAVAGLCALPDHGACTGTPAVQDAAPFPVGAQPGLLDDADLPPVSGVTAPWVGSDPGPATQNAAATRCDDADFSTGFSTAVTRAYLVPSAPRLSAEFGLAETAGTLSPTKARAYVSMVRRRLASCHARDLGTAVTPVTSRSARDADLSVWRLDVDVSKKQTVRFLMAIIRSQGTVAQLTFVPSGQAILPGADFLTLAVRAQQRLAYLTG